MDADRLPDELDSAEALREMVLAQRRELHTLRRENGDIALLVEALDALLQIEGGEDPFASVFAVLRPVFRYSEALVLVEPVEPGEPLVCVVATQPTLVDGTWSSDRLFDKVLAGRVTATGTSRALAAPLGPTGAGVVTPDQPALYLPLGLRRHRGMMVLLRAEGDEGFDRRDIELGRKFSLLASHALAALSANRSESERKRLHQLTEQLEAAQATLTHRANHDMLTGLPNRAFFEEQVTSALSSADDRCLALAFIDLDGFKQVNDRYGHEVGDELLTQVSDRILGLVRSTDVLARISGDEFVLLLDPVVDDAALDSVIERILRALKEPFTIAGVRIAMSASIGIATYPEHGTTYEHLQRNADVAMYSAKSRAKGSAALFDVSLGRAVAERAEREQVVRRAVAERRFRPVLQPLVGLRTMDVYGFEVLARLEDDRGTLHPPSGFIGLAGELGFLDSITLMLLDEVIDVMPSIDAQYGAATSMSINVSARQAVDVPAMRRLVERLEESGRPDRFVIEVTEDAYLHAGVFQRDVLPILHEAGVRVSIDDFGTGFSSLATLLDVEAHELKIDRSFVTDLPDRPRSQVILRGVASAARALGISVVAEGVETEQELRYLQSIPSIRRAQGFLFARPATPTELIATAPDILERLRSLHAANAAPTLLADARLVS